jgi:hypothetical protein
MDEMGRTWSTIGKVYKYKITVGKPEGKIRWEDNIKTDNKVTEWEGVNLISVA